MNPKSIIVHLGTTAFRVDLEECEGGLTVKYGGEVIGTIRRSRDRDRTSWKIGNWRDTFFGTREHACLHLLALHMALKAVDA